MYQKYRQIYMILYKESQKSHRIQNLNDHVLRNFEKKNRLDLAIQI